MKDHAGVASAGCFEILADEGINIQLISTSEIKVSVVLEEKYTELAVRALHAAFVEAGAAEPRAGVLRSPVARERVAGTDAPAPGGRPSGSLGLALAVATPSLLAGALPSGDPPRPCAVAYEEVAAAGRLDPRGGRAEIPGGRHRAARSGAPALRAACSIRTRRSLGPSRVAPGHWTCAGCRRSSARAGAPPLSPRLAELTSCARDLGPSERRRGSLPTSLVSPIPMAGGAAPAPAETA